MIARFKRLTTGPQAFLAEDVLAVAALFLMLFAALAFSPAV